MPSTTPEVYYRSPSPSGFDRDHLHIASLLTSVEKHAFVSQRGLAGELGVALGLVNSYVRRCVKKGLIKVQHAPSRRYAYYLTPKGFAEKSRLTAEYLAWSLTFFRHARLECAEVLDAASARGWTNIALIGSGDLAEIMILSATEKAMVVTAVVDHATGPRNILGKAIVRAPQDVMPAPDGWIVTAITNAQCAFDDLRAQVPSHRIIAPPMLGISRATPLLVDP